MILYSHWGTINFSDMSDSRAIEDKEKSCQVRLWDTIKSNNWHFLVLHTYIHTYTDIHHAL